MRKLFYLILILQIFLFNFENQKLFAQGEIQKPGEIQQPKGNWQQPGEIQKSGEVQKQPSPDSTQPIRPPEPTAEVQQPKGNWQQPKEIQKPKEIQQPTGNWQQPGEVQQPRGIEAIKVQKSQCEERYSVGADVLFEFNKYNLSKIAEETLAALGPMLQKAGAHPIVVEGHTDGIGSDPYNQRLSERRATSVKKWLVSHQFVPASTTIKGYGKKKPIAPNKNSDGSDNPEGRQKNRRVEIVVDICH